MRRAALLLAAALAGCASEPAASTSGDASEAPAQAPQPAEEQAGAASSSPDEGVPAFVRRGPESRDPVEAGIGREVADAAFVDLAGRPGSLQAQLGQAKALVVVFTSLGCPVTKAYAPLLEDLARRCAELGAAFLAVDPALQDSAEALRARAERLGWTFRVTRDPDYALTEALGAERTSDAFVLTPAGLAYRGAIDDQFGINYRLPTPRRRYLLEALEAIVAGRAPEVPATSAAGCAIAKVRVD